VPIGRSFAEFTLERSEGMAPIADLACETSLSCICGIEVSLQYDRIHERVAVVVGREENERSVMQSKAMISAHKHTSLKWSGLQFRMAASYALTTLLAALLLEILVGTTIWALLTYGPLTEDGVIASARQAAELYALTAAVQAPGATLDPQTTFEPGQPSSIALPKDGNTNSVPYITSRSLNASTTAFALLIAPDGHVLASSYPARYPALMPIAQLLPSEAHLIMNGLAGVPGISVNETAQVRAIGAVEAIRNREKKVIGAVYVQEPEVSGGNLLLGFTGALLISGLLWLLITLPVGGLFGLITTRGLVRRIRHLETATARFADGDYTQRVQVTRRDEVGQLEEHFNRMAEQLVESITQRQAFAERNARMVERGRIARDLHDSVKQQVFAVSMQLGAALSLLGKKPEVAQQHLVEAESLAYQVQQELTTLIQELRPLELQDKGLPIALQEYVTTWSRQRGITADLHISDVDALPPALEEALWRVAQEALSNIARHSQASRVEVSLACEPGKIILSITDNGQGFARSTVSDSSVGLHSMQERIQALAGTLTIESKIGEGTRIIAQCPCPQGPDF
jgi:NarL family two-component system sensor histidine kinase LiaS